MSDVLPSVLLVGCGKMGGALLSGWIEQGIAGAVAVDPYLSPADAAALFGTALHVVADAADIPGDFFPSAVLLAVKPQQADAALPLYARFAGHAVFVSIMAGKTLGVMQELLGANAAVVRAMPNTPAAVRQGVTVGCAGGRVSDAQRALADRMLQAVGDVAWVDDEAQIDAVTAVSGSGPAYVFLLAELLERAALEQGLPADIARLLARKTVSGAGALLNASPEDAATLRKNVTSPKGTTERALAVLMEDTAWPQTISRAVAAAAERSRELARGA